jgi:hypothetical protein
MLIWGQPARSGCFADYVGAVVVSHAFLARETKVPEPDWSSLQPLTSWVLQIGNNRDPKSVLAVVKDVCHHWFGLTDAGLVPRAIGERAANNHHAI